ncbi:XdhC family aldehyde oxidoreductase maturation factor [uncultured Desulfobacter sp.]|uniref:XdhC family aldehyde oxidoreductase maturation factor n=1 Tax=uncultured Desulfobacter sp. TaxID=240139 RepID=UPI0029F5CC41|nr:XdhC family protein [uncultured Desulfobacter sp.]
MTSLIQESLELLNNGTPFALAVIIGHKGSTPRTSGSKMLVRLDKSISGTIGGGLVEAKVMNACVDLLDQSRSEIMDFTLDQEIKAGMDMVCGGSLTVWIRSFVPPCPPEQIQVWQTLADLEATGKKALAVTRIMADKTTESSLVLEKGQVVGPSMLPKVLMDAAGENRFTGPAPVRQFYGLDQFIIEPLSRPDTLYIFGAGHVGFQLAKMANLVDFTCVVTDDRAEFANESRFPHSAQIRVLDDFSNAFDGLDIDGNAYIVILTRGHLHDQTVLEQALKTDAAYIGMIGSKKKKKQIYDNLMEKGVAQAQLEQVYAPIGLKIKAETPAEIAVSIMAELIKIRAENKENPS